MLTPTTCLTLTCNGCGTTAETDDVTHLCPDCQCAAHGHDPSDAEHGILIVNYRSAGDDDPEMTGLCLRCGRWLDLTWTDGTHRQVRLTEPAR